jgi:hypothetical protein
MILTDGTTDLALPDDLIWRDRTEWTAVAATDTRGITGKINRQSSTKIAGRPITLSPPMPDMALVPYLTVRTVRDWTDDPAKTMTLTFAGGESFTVRFRYDNDSPLKAEPALGFTRYDDAELWRLTLNLITV